MASRVLRALGDIVRHLPDARRDPLAVLDRLSPGQAGTLVPDIAYGSVPGQRADLHLPPGAASPRSVVLFFHGGRWSYGQKEQYRFVARALSARGHAVAVCDYRKYPEVRFPAFVEDAAAATAWALRELPGRGVPPGRVFLMGHSAGAHLAALSTLDRRYAEGHGFDPDSLTGLVLLSAPFDFLPIREDDLKDIFGPDEEHPRSQPLRFVRPGLPPMLILHGRRDRTVHPAGAARFASAVREAGGDVKAVFYDLLTHTNILAALSDRIGFLFAPVLDDVTSFLDARLRRLDAQPEAARDGRSLDESKRLGSPATAREAGGGAAGED